MADLGSTKVFGSLTVIHQAILKANAEIAGTVTAGSFTGEGSLITNLNASNLASGTVATARLPAAALIGDTTYSAGTGLTLSGTTFSLSDERYTTAEKNKLGGIESGATADQTKADIDALNVDADTLDGYHASALMRKGSSFNNIDSVESTAGRHDPSVNNPTNTYYAAITYGNDDNVVGQLATHFSNGTSYLRAYNTAWSAWRKIWTDGNFNPANYLGVTATAADSQKLDNLDSTQFLRSDEDDITTGTITSKTYAGTSFRFAGRNDDLTLFRVDAGEGNTDKSNYGFSFLYKGTQGGNDNEFQILADNTTNAAQNEAFTIKQNGVLYQGGVNEILHTGNSDKFSTTGNYTGLRAQSTTATDVGLGNVPNSNNLSSFVNGPSFVDAAGARSAIEAGNLTHIDGVNGHRIKFDTSASWIEITDQANNRSDIVTANVYVNDLAGGTWLGSLTATDIGALPSGSKAADSNLLDGQNGTYWGHFGNHYTHSSTSDFNANIQPGWSFVNGTVNRPPSGSTQHYRLRTGLGSDYGTNTANGNYANEVAIGRKNSGSDNAIWGRQLENGTWTSWQKFDAGQADNADKLDNLNSTQFLRSDAVNTGYLNINRNGQAGNVIDIDHVENGNWPFVFRSSTVGNDNPSGFWVNSNGTPDMRLRATGSTVTTLIHSSGDSYFNGGNVGIGNESPNYKLDVAGDVSVRDNATVYSDSANTEGCRVEYNATSKSLEYNFF